MKTDLIPARADVSEKDKWDLSTLFKSEDEWEAALRSIEDLSAAVTSFKGRLTGSAESLLGALRAFETLYKTCELVSSYASLLHASDEGDPDTQGKEGRATMAFVEADSECSFFQSELMAADEETILKWSEQADFADYKVFLKKALYLKPYILSEKEERVMSLQLESAQTASKAFALLTNVDMDFGSIKIKDEKAHAGRTKGGTRKKTMPLTQSTWTLFMENPDRGVREAAYKQFYGEFEKHQNTIAALYAGSVAQDVFDARVRGYKSSLAAALYSDKVDESVYRNLIETVHANLGTLHRFYSLRKRVLHLDELRHYDVYVPLVSDVKTNTSYEQAVEICRAALSPLGREYTDTLCSGLTGGWVDRYENKGKRSGAFSTGAYSGYPYILLNYKSDAIRDVFTMAHEGGHSMHTYYSRQNNPFLSYGYTIFEAEVASTFNEELVFEYLLKNAEAEDNKPLKTYLLSMRANDILATLHRQTMFAEFELKTHELFEDGTPLSSEVLRSTYRDLLEQYFGPEMVFESNSDMEGLRIPHFYNAFYVYKYSTGISAALALAKRVCEGGKSERDDYFAFLKSGGSRYPIESLKTAGVDMSTSEPIQSALDTFAKITAQLESELRTS